VNIATKFCGFNSYKMERCTRYNPTRSSLEVEHLIIIGICFLPSQKLFFTSSTNRIFGWKINNFTNIFCWILPVRFERTRWRLLQKRVVCT